MDFQNLPLSGNLGNALGLNKPKATGPAGKNPIKEFVSAVKSGGLAVSNRYAVGITLPFAFNDDITRKAFMYCDQIQLPGSGFSTTQNRSFGEFRETPYEKLYDPITLSFYVDREMQVKNLFDQWMEHICNPKTRTFNYYSKYVTKMDIEVQDQKDKSRYYVTLHECYPKTVGAIQLDYASKDIMKLSVSFAYKYFETKTDVPDMPTSPSAQASMSTQDKLMNFAKGAAGSYAVTQIPKITSKLPKIGF